MSKVRLAVLSFAVAVDALELGHALLDGRDNPVDHLEHVKVEPAAAELDLKRKIDIVCTSHIHIYLLSWKFKLIGEFFTCFYMKFSDLLLAIN